MRQRFFGAPGATIAALVGALAAGLVLLAPAPRAHATTEAEQGFLGLYFTAEELAVFSATRSLKSIAAVAENVTVVTAEQIALMNAHTVAEALSFVTGVEITDFKGPGSGSQPSIHGSGTTRVTVMLDGVPFRTANNDFQLTTMPVQMVEKIEVVKGPASSTWGSSFGGVINVITKAAPSGTGGGGMVSASYGQEDTSDLRAEFSGRKGGFGLYLYGGTMNSDGLRELSPFTHDDLFAKASLGAPGGTRLDLTFLYHDGDGTNSDFRPLRDVFSGTEMKTLHGRADLRTSLGEADLLLTGWWLRKDDTLNENVASTGTRSREAATINEERGLSGSLAWRAGSQSLVAGVDLSGQQFEQDFEQHLSIDENRTAVFANDTIAAGAFSVTPGLRYDHSTRAGGILSPSLGATWLAAPDFLLRAIVSRGFHDPPIVRYFDAPDFGYYANPGLVPEKIVSYQLGAEANLFDLLRTKLTFFYHDVDDILVEKFLGKGTFTMENGGRARTGGGEIEVSTSAYHDFVLDAGAHYERTRRLDFHDPLTFDVREIYGVNAGLTYDDRRGLSATLKARYLAWDMTEFWRADSDGIVVDASVTKRIPLGRSFAPDLFVSGHNLFNASSYNDQFQKNPGRWLEAGVRCSF